MKENQNNQEQLVNNEQIIEAIKQSIDSTIKGLGSIPSINEDKLSQLISSAIEQSKVTEKQAQEVEEVSDMILENGWYDEKSGKIDTSKIKNPEVLAALQMLEGKYNAEKDERLILDAISAEAKNRKLNISTNTLRKLLDTSGYKIEDGKVTGVTESFDTLEQAESGLFKASKAKSSPLSESFNPVERSNTGAGSFAQAFSMMEDTN